MENERNMDGHPVKKRINTATLVSSYVPRQCGLGTFAKDLRDAIAEQIGQKQTTVVAMDDNLANAYAYPDEVTLQIPQHEQVEYTSAGELLNINQIDVAYIQHEYGIFGGRDGSHVLELARTLRMPIITTLHTVLKDPSPGQRSVLRELCRESDRLVVMSELARQMLREIYNVAERKIALIPHGIPDVPFVEPCFFSDQFACEGRTVLLTFGLLSPGKGVEVAIRAMPKIVERFPNILYIILGATHPHVLRDEGNAYHDRLKKLVEELGMENHVRFHNHYVTKEDLIRYIGVAEIYLTPYPNEKQITSGTLAYAVGAGKAVVSTPYWHANELLADGRGRLFPFGDSDALAGQVLELLANPAERRAMRKRAYMHGRPMVWSAVAKAYLDLAGDVLAERRETPRPISTSRVEPLDVSNMPEVNLSHLYRLTDDTGILQHAVYATPNRHHGYCVDDNARALVLGLMYHDLSQDDSILPRVDTYLSFVHHAYNPATGRFRNFMSYDRQWLEEVGSEDSHGRSMWALGTAVRLSPNDGTLSLCTRMFQEVLDKVTDFTSPRAWAFALIGIDYFLHRFSGDTRSRRVRQTLADRLMRRFTDNSTTDWPWLEDSVTYDNATLPHSLLLAGQALGDQPMIDQALLSLNWLVEHQTLPDGRISLIGNMGWMTREGHRPRFDQQPIEAMAMIQTCASAFRITHDVKWFDRTRQFLGWFLGNNDTRSRLYDYQTGGCKDGLHSDGPNHNQGAESTLAWLISTLSVMELNSRRADQTPRLTRDRTELSSSFSAWPGER